MLPRFLSVFDGFRVLPYRGDSVGSWLRALLGLGAPEAPTPPRPSLAEQVSDSMRRGPTACSRPSSHREAPLTIALTGSLKGF